MQWNGASGCEFDRKSMETETATWSQFPNEGKTIVEQILASEESITNFSVFLNKFLKHVFNIVLKLDNHTWKKV